MPTSLVTGGAGFLGSHLCEYLLEQGHRVICVDNLIVSTLENIEHLRDDGFVFRNHDMIDPLFVDEEIDYLFHLAALASPIDYLRMPLHSLKTGSYGTHHALGLAKFKRARFLLASTSEVYGDPEVHPQPESYWGNVNPIGPRGVYDEAKRYAEAMTMAYHGQQGVDTSIARIFNTYGPRMRPYDGRAIPTFIRQALDNKPLTVFGEGSQTQELLLRRRPDPRSVPARRERRAPAHQPGQSGGIHDPRARGGGHPSEWVGKQDRVRGASRRRPAGAAAGHHARPRSAGMGARDRSRRGSTKNAGVTRS